MKTRRRSSHRKPASRQASAAVKQTRAAEQVNSHSASASLAAAAPESSTVTAKSDSLSTTSDLHSQRTQLQHQPVGIYVAEASSGLQYKPHNFTDPSEAVPPSLSPSVYSAQHAKISGGREEHASPTSFAVTSPSSEQTQTHVSASAIPNIFHVPGTTSPQTVGTVRSTEGRSPQHFLSQNTVTMKAVAPSPPGPEHTYGHVAPEATGSPYAERPLVIAYEDEERVVRTPGSRGRSENGSPVELTELVTVNSSKLYVSPPSDRNHNVPLAYHADLALASTSSSSHSLLPPIATISYRTREAAEEEVQYERYYGVGGGGGSEHSHAVYEDRGLTTLTPITTMYAVSPAPPPYTACPGSTWSAYPYPLTPTAAGRSYGYTGDTSSDHSSPESLQRSYHSATSSSTLLAYASPSGTTAGASPHGSPESAVPLWSVDRRDNGSAVCVGPAHTAQGDYKTGTGSSASVPSSAAGHPASVYYSEDSGADMREIQQEILRADIERHIYENYGGSIVYPEDDDDDDEDDDEDDETEDDTSSSSKNPAKRKSGSSSGGGGKKRRRRTQTPTQRRAANMRERKRMCHLNFAFDALKNRLPNVRNRKKLSRIQTLRAAIFYIGLLAECLQSG